MYRTAACLALVLLLVTAGCNGTKTPPVPSPVPSATPVVTLSPASPPLTPSPSPTIAAAPYPSLVSPSPTTVTPLPSATSVPVPVPTTLSEEALNARIVDARNKLNNLIDSDAADTIVLHPDQAQGCEVKTSRELGYLIDATTGESTFVKGDYGSISAKSFRDPMNKDHEYVIIHTHPRMWATCPGSGITSLYTFSIGDLAAVSSLASQGYHVKYIIAIADKEYRIWPKVPGNWKSQEEVRAAISRIEQRLDAQFAFYDPVLEQEYYNVDSLMPLLTKELDYSYTANNHVIS
ncbi:MAG: hypothetical protein GYA23_10465 [Methanomicrobiales archaeon]|nr:hypothetical protein [Methanomicrobiales archaeon]